MPAKEFDSANVPSPDELLGEAVEHLDNESRIVPLSGYIDTIDLLREKGYSWRKIAAFLQERGIDANHNEIYYVSKKAKENDPATDPLEVESMTLDKEIEDQA